MLKNKTAKELYYDFAERSLAMRMILQAGTCWAPALGITEEEADQKIRNLISELLPGQVDWQKL